MGGRAGHVTGTHSVSQKSTTSHSNVTFKPLTVTNRVVDGMEALLF